MTHILCQELTIYLTRLEMRNILPQSGYWQIPVHPDDREKLPLPVRGPKEPSHPENARPQNKKS